MPSEVDRRRSNMHEFVKKQLDGVHFFLRDEILSIFRSQQMKFISRRTCPRWTLLEWRALHRCGVSLGAATRRPICKNSANCCSFSAVSAPIFARKYAFDSIFQALQDVHTFALLQTQHGSKKRFKRFVYATSQKMQSLQMFVYVRV